MKLPTVLLATLLATIPVSQSMALGLGEVQMHSKIGFPMEAYLKLSGAESFTADQLKVRLANNDAYEQAGAFRAYYLTRIQFEILDRGEYGSLVRLRTERPILDPYMDLIVEAESDYGTVVRHYPVMVDFPK